jgi:hypothetical protein
VPDSSSRSFFRARHPLPRPLSYRRGVDAEGLEPAGGSQRQSHGLPAPDVPPRLTSEAPIEDADRARSSVQPFVCIRQRPPGKSLRFIRPGYPGLPSAIPAVVFIRSAARGAASASQVSWSTLNLPEFTFGHRVGHAWDLLGTRWGQRFGRGHADPPFPLVAGQGLPPGHVLRKFLCFADRAYPFADEHSGIIRLPLANGGSEAGRATSASRE